VNNLQLKGRWWIPSNPTKQIIGVLRSEEYNNPTLNLESSFWDEPWAKVSKPELILGELEDKRNITLYNVETQSNVLVSLSFRIDFVFMGIHFHAPLVISRYIISTDIKNHY
jgi:ApeA N-terminal domain 1